MEKCEQGVEIARNHDLSLLGCQKPCPSICSKSQPHSQCLSKAPSILCHERLSGITNCELLSEEHSFSLIPVLPHYHTHGLTCPGLTPRGPGEMFFYLGTHTITGFCNLLCQNKDNPFCFEFKHQHVLFLWRSYQSVS